MRLAREKRKFIEIPRVNSKPADPSQKSILTTFPGELRNIIYDFLFKRDKPILIYDAKACREAIALEIESLLTAPNQKLIEAYESYEEEWASLTGEGSEVYHGIQNGIVFTYTCRQIYSEAVRVLYGNVFMTTRTFSCQRNWEEKDCGIPFLEKWIWNLGSQASLLTKVLVDIQCLCVESCNADGFDILPLLRLIWSSDTKCEVKFAASGRNHLCEGYFEGEDAEPMEWEDVDTLNNILHAISSEGDLRVHKLRSFPGLIHHIRIHTRTTGGVGRGIIFYQSSKPLHGYEQCYYPDVRGGFHITDNGRTLQFDRVPIPLTLGSHRISNELRNRIFESLLCLSSEIVFDLDTHTVHGLDFTILHIGSRLREDLRCWAEASWVRDKSATTVVKMTSAETTTSFNSFNELDYILRQHDDGFFFPEKYRPGTYEGLTVHLNFDIDRHTALSDVRIDIQCFLRLTIFWNDCVTVQLKKLSENNGANSAELATVTLGDLRREVFLLLTLIIQNSPDRQYEPLPHIWINGHGRVLGATYRPTAISPRETIQSESLHLSKDAIRTLGDAQSHFEIEEIEAPRSWSDRRYVEAWKYQTCLQLIWRQLRVRYYRTHWRILMPLQEKECERRFRQLLASRGLAQVPLKLREPYKLHLHTHTSETDDARVACDRKFCRDQSSLFP